MTFDVERARRETPGCENVLHFNNAGASLMPAPVLDAQIAYLRREAEIGGYETELESADALSHTYDALASLINCRPDEIAVMENATRAWDMAFYAFPFAAGDRILTGRCEYASNAIAMLHVRQKTGAEIVVIDNDADGQIDLDALAEALDDRARLIALTHVPTNGGLVNPAAAVGKIAKAAGVPYLLDACQSIGQMPIDVEAIGCDALSATGRKFLRGPRGTGFLYVRRALSETLEPPLLDMTAADWVATDRYQMHPDARRFETFEMSFAGKVGLGVAADYALSWGLEAIQARVQSLAETLRHRLRELSGITVHDLGRERCGIVTFTHDVHSPSALRVALSAQQINIWTSPLTSTRYDMEARGLAKVARASLHYYNTEAEIDRFCAALNALSSR